MDIKVSDNEWHTFGRYIPVKLLGKGAMGRVYLANDPVLQRSVAVKVISIENNLDEVTRDSYLERFSLEARASAKLKHSSIVTVYDAGEQDGTPWIAFEYVEGESLEDLLIREKQLSNNQIKNILTDIVSALCHAHDAGIVHRDIKPANILIDKKSGISKLSDFGVIKAPFSMVTQEGMTLGSPGYMSPEQIDGSGVDSRSDLFSVGIIFYQMLTGKHPFLRETLQSTFYATLMGEYTQIREVLPNVDEKTELIIVRLLKVKKDERTTSAAELLAMLTNCTVYYSIQSDSNQAGARIGGFDLKYSAALLKVLKPVLHVIKKTDEAIFNFIEHSKAILHVKCKICFPRKKCNSLWNNILVGQIINNRKSRMYWAISSSGILMLLSFWFVFSLSFGLNSEEKRVLRELAKDGYKGNPVQLVKKCSSLIERNKLNDARKIAEALVKIRRESAHAYLLNALIEIRDEDEDDVIEAINNAKRYDGFKRSFSREKETFITALKELLSKDEISREMIDCICYTLKLGKDHEIKKWPYEKAYWLRWNSIRILNEVDQKIDMVEVYILDLNYAGSMRERIKAANKLGKLKDKRAVPVLQDVARRGFADPIVSVAAQSALDEYKK